MSNNYALLIYRYTAFSTGTGTASIRVKDINDMVSKQAHGFIKEFYVSGSNKESNGLI
jgi:hypothetical protein